MFRKIFTFFALTLALQLSMFGADQSLSTIKECSPELRYSVNQIQKLPEGRELISQVQKQGPVKVFVNRTISEQFGAFWDPDRRMIFVTLSHDREEGSVIGSILFELHNALSSSKLDHYDFLARSGQIDRESYVESVERLEYQNSLKTAAIAEKGIQKGLFARGARMPTYPTFAEHFRIQKMGGHSAWIANNYDQLSSSHQSMYN